MLDSPSIGTAEPVFYSLLGQIVQGAGVQIGTGTNVTGQPTNINYFPVSSTGVAVVYAPQFATTVTGYSANEWQLTPIGTNRISPWYYMQPQNIGPSITGPNFIGFVRGPVYEDFSSTAMTDVSSPLTKEELFDIGIAIKEVESGKAKHFKNLSDAIEWLDSDSG